MDGTSFAYLLACLNGRNAVGVLRMHVGHQTRHMHTPGNPATTLGSIRAWTEFISSGQTALYTVELDFSASDCRSKGAPSAGVTYAGT